MFFRRRSPALIFGGHARGFVQIGIGVERLDQLRVGDDVFRRKNAVT